jgi:putative ABC transport system permease protein
MVSDLKFSLRQLTKSPGFTAIAVFTLALGIGACTAMFSVVNSVLLRPIAYPESERLVIIRESFPPQYPVFSVAPANFRDWEQQNTVFEAMYAQRNSTYALTGRGEPARVLALRVTGRYFDVIRTPAMLGRVFGPADDRPEAGKVVVLSYAFWQKQLGGRTDVLQERLQLNGDTFTIIGVMPASFQRGYPFEIITPMAFEEREWQDRGAHYIYVGARMKPTVTIEQVRAEMSAIAARLADQYVDNKGWGTVVDTLLDNNTAAIRPTLYTLLAAVAVLLSIACANVANLLLARATVRQRELSIRAALGASQWRIIRQLFTENLLLALCGGLLGILVGKWGLDAMLALAPRDLPRAAEISLDGRVLVVTLGMTLLTGMGFGVVPALQAMRIDLVEALKEGARGTSDSGHRHLLRHGLVVTEIALAVMLLASAGLLIRSFVRLNAFNPGFNPQGALLASVSLPPAKYPTTAAQATFVDQVLQRYRALPGVTAAGAAQVFPMGGNDYMLSLEIEGRDVPEPELPATNYYSVTPDYFEAAGIPLLRGRLFNAQDRADSPPVAIISQSLADKLFPGVDPLGQRIHPTQGTRNWREIVGVVGEVRQYGVDRETAPQSYVPFAQAPFTSMTFVVRADAPAADLPPRLRQEIYAVDPNQPVGRLEPVQNLLTTSMARQRFAATLLAVFSGLALVLAVVGIYGVMAYAVAQRTGEFGIRLALGAQPRDILRLVLTHGGRLIGAGLAVGLLAALAVGQFIQAMLYQTPPRDPLVFGAIALLLAGAALFACLIPALRATRVDPMVALRSE